MSSNTKSRGGANTVLPSSRLRHQRLLPKGIESVDASSRHARCMNPISCAGILCLVASSLCSEHSGICSMSSPLCLALYTRLPVPSWTRHHNPPDSFRTNRRPCALAARREAREMLPATSAWEPVDLHVERQEGSNILPPAIRHESSGTS